MPKVTVIMNCYNSAEHLREAMDSVFRQSWPDWEIVFWDNCSTDDSAAIAQSYGEKVRDFLAEKTVPLGAARNLAIAKAEGSLLAFLDCDDEWLSTKLEKQVMLFNANPRLGLVSTDTEMFSEKGTLSRMFESTHPARGMVFRELMTRQWISMSSAMIRKSALDSLGEWFDAVAIDAPCSGEGMFRKSPEARGEWSEANVRLCAARQRRIVSDAWAALRPGGVLIYSTCTFNRTEDEENVRWIAEELGGEDAGAMVPPDWGIEEREAGGVRCFRLWPHRIAGEGFFAAAIRKGGQRGRPLRPKPRKTLLAEASRSETAELSRWVGQPDLMRFARIGDSLYGYYATPFADIRSAAEYLNTLHSGICMGQMFGGRLKPDHSLAMFHDLARSAAAETPLSSDEALHYLRREDFAPQAEAAEGMNLMTFEGYALGWAKRIGNRFNNLYPKSQMILNK
mgnify:CR=1 FL=1